MKWTDAISAAGVPSGRVASLMAGPEMVLRSAKAEALDWGLRAIVAGSVNGPRVFCEWIAEMAVALALEEDPHDLELWGILDGYEKAVLRGTGLRDRVQAAVERYRAAGNHRLATLADLFMGLVFPDAWPVHLRTLTSILGPELGEAFSRVAGRHVLALGGLES